MAPKKNDEIDLLELLIRFIRFFKKSFWILTLLFLIGSILGYLKVEISESHYETSITATSSVDIDLTVDILNGMAGKLNTQPDKNNLKLHLKKLEASKIDGKVTKDKLKRINIIVQYYNKSNLELLRDNLKEYVENNYFIHNSIQLQKKQYTELISKIEKEITELDNLQATFLNNRINSKKETLIISENSNSSEQMVLLYEKKHELEQQLLLSGFQIIDNSAPLLSKKAKLLTTVILGGLCLSFIGLIFLLGRKFNQKYL